jgi:hypothetical protein
MPTTKARRRVTPVSIIEEEVEDLETVFVTWCDPRSGQPWGGPMLAVLVRGDEATAREAVRGLSDRIAEETGDYYRVSGYAAEEEEDLHLAGDGGIEV